MPQEPDYRTKIYENLVSAYGKDELPDINTFNQKLDSDKEYATKIFENLVTAYGKDELPEQTDFFDKIKKKNLSEQDLSVLGGQSFKLGTQNISPSKSESTSTPKTHPAVAAFNKKYGTTLTDAQIQGKEPVIKSEVPTALESAGQQALSSIEKLGGGLLKAPATLERNILNVGADIAGMDEKNKVAMLDAAQTFNEGTNAMATGNTKAANVLFNDAAERTKLLKNAPKAEDLFKEGKYIDAAKYFGADLAGILPVLGAFALNAPTAIAALHGQQAEEVANNPNMTENEKQLNTALHTAINAGGTILATRLVGKGIGEIIDKYGADKAGEIAAKTISIGLKEMVKKTTVLKTPVIGYIDGYAMQVGNNIVDKYTNPDAKDVDITEGANKSGLMFGALGLPEVIGRGTGAAYEAISNAKARKKVQDLEAQNEKLSANLERPDLPEEVKNSVHEEIVKNTETINNEVIKHQEQTDQFPPEIKQKLEENNQKISDYEKALNGEQGQDEQLKKIFETKLSEINKENQNLIKEGENYALDAKKLAEPIAEPTPEEMKKVLAKDIGKHIEKADIEMLKNNITKIGMEKFMRNLEGKGLIKIRC